MSLELKIKAEALAAEARIIRQEEEKIGRRIRGRDPFGKVVKWNVSPPPEAQRLAAREARLVRRAARAATKAAIPVAERLSKLRLSLRDHRLGLSDEARSTHLARTFLKGQPYTEVENRRYSWPDWNAIHRMAEKYAGYRKMGDQDGYGFASVQQLAQQFEQWKQTAESTGLSER